ncbi:cytochrome P450, partial [Streptomyces broussonetiae]|uniref:cytochrome P450 n=1 Tax=Streptomyces broussonetiae TaxID=2686304 RepID=UPI0035D712E9
MTELTDTTVPATPAEPVAFPQDRTCPYHPPTGYEPLRDGRALSRVTLFDGREVWAVTGHAAARALLSDPRLSSDRCRPDFPIPAERFQGARDRRVALLGLDDPEHNRQRRMMIPDFTVRRATELRPWIQQVVDRLLDTMIAQGPPAELVSAFALPVPSTVICGLLGVPYADHEFFEEQSRRLLRGPRAADSVAARVRLEEYIGGLIEDKAKEAEPGDGILDDLVHHQLRDGTLERTDVVSLALILLVAGHETTANMISLGTFTLLQHPDRLAELRADPALLPAAVEELMRMLSIAEGLQRVALEDIEVDGHTI